MDGYLCHMTVTLYLLIYRTKEKRHCVIWLSFLKNHYHFHIRKSPLPSMHSGNSHPSQGVIASYFFVVVPNSSSVVPINKILCFLSWNICILWDWALGWIFHNIVFLWILGFIWRNVVEVGINLFFVFSVLEQLRMSNICGILIGASLQVLTLCQPMWVPEAAWFQWSICQALP